MTDADELNRALFNMGMLETLCFKYLTGELFEWWFVENSLYPKVNGEEPLYDYDAVP